MATFSETHAPMPRSARFRTCVYPPRMTVKRKAAVRPMLESIAVPYAEPLAVTAPLVDTRM